VTYIKGLWSETFPNEEGNVRTKIEQRKAVAKMQKELELKQ
jgi:hypothetical protein